MTDKQLAMLKGLILATSSPTAPLNEQGALALIADIEAARAEVARLTRELAESRANERTAVDDAATKLVGAERQREGVLETCKAYAYNLDQFRQQNDKCIAIVNAVGNLGAAFGGGSRIGALRGFAKFVRQEFMLPVTASALEELAAAYAALQPFPHVVVGESQWEEGKP